MATHQNAQERQAGKQSWKQVLVGALGFLFGGVFLSFAMRNTADIETRSDTLKFHGCSLE
jgi:hypothetical protein